MQKLISLLTLFFICGQTFSQHFVFERSDTLVVIHGTDTLDYAWSGGMNYCQFSKVDMDLDGDKDLLVFDRTGDQLLTFENLGGPGIKYRYNPDFANLFPAGINSWILMIDYNCDGKEDIFTYYPGGIYVYRNVSVSSLQFQLVTTSGAIKSNQLGNFFNLLVTAVDIPAIFDVDNDGDMDVLTFGQFGKYLEYHKNYSVENGHGCDSLEFVLRNECWGCWRENSANCTITLNDTCTPSPFLGGPPEMAPFPDDYRHYDPLTAGQRGHEDEGGERVHTGSSVLAINLNNLNAVDLLIGDVSCNHLTMMLNGGTAPNQNTCMTSIDYTFPSYDVPVDLPVFPAAFYVDIDNDAKRDLLVSPNYTTLSMNHNGNLFYKNTGTDAAPVFAFQQNAFMQDEMIELGEGSVPSFFDHNQDGLLDMAVSSFGIFDPYTVSWQRYVSRITLYENVGTTTKPVFKRVNSDLGSVYSVIDTTNLLPTFADLDGDGDADMVVGDITGRLHYFVNTATTGNPATYSIAQMYIKDNNNDTIDIGSYAAPHLVDMDRDGDFDLVIGGRNGKLNYYENIGTPSSAIFRFITNNFGNVKVNDPWTPYGHSIPYVYDYGNKYHLFVGSMKGRVFHYDSLDNNLAGNFRLLDSVPDPGGYFGIRAAAAVANLNGDTLPEMMVGNYRGGLVMYTATDENNAIHEITAQSQVIVMPNPGSDRVRIETNMPGEKYISFYSVEGKLLARIFSTSQQETLDVSHLVRGLYIIHVSAAGGRYAGCTTRWVKQ